jgi:predicted peptidase
MPRQKSLWLIFILAVLLTPGFAQNSDASHRQRLEAFQRKAQRVTPGFESHTFRASAGQVIPYRLFRPVNTGKSALVLYLHGGGALGSDNQAQIAGGNLFGSHIWALEENQMRHPAFVLAPQTGLGWEAGTLMELLEEIFRQLPIDRGRVYVTGQSMGGTDTWMLAESYPEVFAAAIPVCGSGDVAKAPRLRSLPIWAFHGYSDRTISARQSRKMVKAVRTAGGKPLYTEYPTVGHNAWEWAYLEPALVEWLFSQHK